MQATSAEPNIQRSDHSLPRISVVVLAWNTRELALRCVQSIVDNCDIRTTEVIVVDNASEDGTAATLRQRFPHVRVIENERNLGTAAGFNLAMRAAGGELILRMEADAYVQDGVIERMAEFMRSNPDVGLLGCEHRFPDGRHQHTPQRQMSIRQSFVERFWLYRLVPSRRRAGILLNGYWPAEEAVEADWLAGITMVSRDAFMRTGGMDERFFLGGEESEWAHRIRRAGYRVVYQPNLGVIYHVGSASWNEVWTDRGRLRGWQRAGLESYAAQHGSAAAAAYRFVETCGVLFRAAVYGVVHRLRPSAYYETQAQFYRMLFGFYLHPGELPGERRPGKATSVSERVDRLDPSLFDPVGPALTSTEDQRSLLALHAALGGRGSFSYLEVGSYLGGSLQAFLADPRCRRIVSIDKRESISQDERLERPGYPDNATARMLERLSGVPGGDLSKLTTIDGGTDTLDPQGLSVDLCLIDAEHTNAAALRDARFCRQVVRDRGVIVFHDRTLVDRGIRRFLAELPDFRAYPLAHELFVVELGVPSLLSDPRVKAQLPRAGWLAVDRVRGIRPALWLTSTARRLQAVCGRLLLAVGAPRRRGRAATEQRSPGDALFEIYTFVNDNDLYETMVESFTDAGFSPDAFEVLTDAGDDPYAAITRIGRESKARYPILCHQDVRAHRRIGAKELAAALEGLDSTDTAWVVAGNAGCMRDGRGVRRLVDPGGGSTDDLWPVPVVTLDENFLVFNGRHQPMCSEGIGGFHLYGTDVCLHALRSGGGAYVIDFPITHLGGRTDSASQVARRASFETVQSHFTEIWGRRLLFCYLVTPMTGLFISRSSILRRLFGSAPAMACIGRAVQTASMRPR